MITSGDVAPIGQRGGRFITESRPAVSPLARNTHVQGRRLTHQLYWVIQMTSKCDLTAQRLRLVLSYDPDTGEFTRLIGHKRLIGRRAGNIHHSGYLRIRVDKRHYLAHRLAWLYTHGVWPKIIDHANRDKLDNRLCNLREATTSQNNVNCVPRAASGFEGVYRDARCVKRPWIAQISYAGKTTHLGNFAEAEDAADAFHRASVEMHGEFAALPSGVSP